MFNMKSIFALKSVLFSILMTIVFVNGVSASDELDKDWKLVKNKNNIKVYMKHTDNSKLKTFKGVTDFQVDEPLKLISVVNDYENLATLLHFISSVEELDRQSDIERDLRVKTFLPWPVKNRETVLSALIKQDPQTLNTEIKLSEIKDKYPQLKNYIRMPFVDAELTVELLDDKNIRLTYRAILDPGGYIPAVLVNLILKDVPYYSLRRITRILQGDAYKGMRETYIKYPEQW